MKAAQNFQRIKTNTAVLLSKLSGKEGDALPWPKVCSLVMAVVLVVDMEPHISYP